MTWLLYSPEIAKQWDKSLNGRYSPDKISPYSKKRVWWHCEQGHVWETTVGDRTSYQTGCPFCSNKRVLTGYNDLATIFPDISKEWAPYANPHLSPEQVTPGSSKRVLWRCEQGHLWSATVNDRTHRKNSCPYCAGRLKQVQAPNTSLYGWCMENSRDDVLASWDWDSNASTPMTVTPKSLGPVIWKCDKGHFWSSSVISRLDKNGGCPHCLRTK